MAVKMFAPNYHDIPLFKGLGREEINEVLHKFHGLIKHFPKSDYIYLAGDCIENLCVVMEGTVQMIKEDIWGEKSIIANLSAGDVFAENYLGKLSDHSEINRRLMCNIVSILADNNTRLIEKTEILCKKTLRGKIMAYLEQEARYNGSDKFTIPFNRTDLANYLDADRSALTRELARMRADGLISFEKNTFEILEHSHTE
ncbi:Crp/Fnr family transcriptional regulator [Phascolarctobacterium succinatutens]|uniref:Crp/Fnr family transcriptional regulator n=1 Tax=Phascolarctobacterium succinatutens TaxID=626940 RepID=UPI003FD87934